MFQILLFFMNILGLSVGCKMPSGCVGSKPQPFGFVKRYNINCKVNDPIKLKSSFNWTKKECYKKYDKHTFVSFWIGAKNKKSDLIDSSLVDRYNSIFVANWSLSFVFDRFSGINMEPLIEIPNKQYFKIFISNMNFDFFVGKNRVTRCEDFPKFDASRRFIFKFVKNRPFSLFLNKVNFKPICELIFRNVNTNLAIDTMMNSFYKSSVFRLLRSNLSAEMLNTRVDSLELNEIFNLDLDETILNEKVFRKTLDFVVSGEIRSIQTDLFKRLPAMRSLTLMKSNTIGLFRRQGIDWIRRSMNSDVRVNLSNTTEILAHTSRTIVIRIELVEDFNSGSEFQFFEERDFCLFKDFPFNQMVFIEYYFTVYKSLSSNSFRYKCPSIWLIQFNSKISKLTSSQDNYFFDQSQLRKINVSECGFEEKLRRCNRHEFKRKAQMTSFSLDFMLVSEFLVILFSPLVCVFAMCVNSLIIIVVLHKKNRLELKENQYKYALINSAVNLFICAIQILGLVNECQEPFGFYCSSIRELQVIQYFKIVFDGFFSAFFRLMSNFTYVGFSICRLSLIGQDHDKATKFVSRLKIWKFILFSIVLSTGLSVCKALRYRANKFSRIRSFPLLIFQQDEYYDPNNKVARHLKIVSSFTAVYDVINYVVFVLVTLFLDACLVKRMRKVIREKEAKFHQSNGQQQEAKSKKQNEEAMKKVIRMVITYSVVSLVLKTPITVTSMNDMNILLSTHIARNLYYHRITRWHSFSYRFSHICYMDRICEIFEKYGNLFFLISLSLNYFFLKRFDRKFRTGILNVSPALLETEKKSSLKSTIRRRN